MKKIQFNFNNLELVKGCPTDINGNGQQDDDYNNDGVTDQNDQDYYDGYMEGYEGTGGSYPENEDENSDAYNAGYNAGWSDDFWDDHGSGTQGPDIKGDDFDAPNGY